MQQHATRLSILFYFAAGIAAGAASATYLVFHYQPILLNGAIHAGIFALGLVAIVAFKRRLDRAILGWYLVGALPVHLAIHFVVIGDLAHLIGVSHMGLYLLSFP